MADWFSWTSDPQAWVSLLTLVILEIVLGVDNVIFISILSEKLPKEQQPQARNIGLGLALGTRILLLMSLSYIIRLEDPLFTWPILNLGASGRDLILLGGGLFLLGKSTYEIHHKLEGEEEHKETKTYPSLVNIIIQILILDVVFSLDSVITAVGIVDELPIMIIAVIVAIAVMLIFAGTISDFVNRHPTVKMLALSFLLLIGFTLVAESFHTEIPKGYIYGAMAFSMFVELLNLQLRSKKATPVHLRQAPYEPSLTPAPVIAAGPRPQVGSRFTRDDGKRPAPHNRRRKR